jgi:PhnB protein
MASVSTYLNFPGNTEEAFLFYQSVFGGEFEGGIVRMDSVPETEGHPPLSEENKKLVMHVCLPILGGHKLMATDATESMGLPPVKFGNNIFINLQPDTREESDRIFAALSAGGKADMPMQEMFWGDYFGSLTDKFGVQWMLACSAK